MWEEYYSFKNKEYFDELYINKLKKSLNVLIGEENSDKLVEFIKTVDVKKYSSDYDKIFESIEIGKYKITAYSNKSGYVEFYISK